MAGESLDTGLIGGVRPYPQPLNFYSRKNFQNLALIAKAAATDHLDNHNGFCFIAFRIGASLAPILGSEPRIPC